MATMNTKGMEQRETLDRTVDGLLALGKVAVAYARVERAPRLPDGRRETDVEHSFLLSVSAAEIAAEYFPDLDTGLVAMFANIHDLPEVYTGDVWTFEISDKERAKKEEAEQMACERLYEELPPFTASLLRRYEKQEEPEARFVRFVDKAMPAIINMLAGDACTFMDDHNVHSAEDLRVHRVRHAERLQRMFSEFPLMHEIRNLISERMEQHFFPASRATI